MNLTLKRNYFFEIMLFLFIFLFWDHSFASEFDYRWSLYTEIDPCNKPVNSCNLAINNHGVAIAVFNNEVFGTYQHTKKKWEFIYPFRALSHKSSIHNNLSIEALDGINVSAATQATVAINDQNHGVALFVIQEGDHQGRLASLFYLNNAWSNFLLVSDQRAAHPVVIQTSTGMTFSLWINAQKNDPYEGCIMAAYHGNTQWIALGPISKRKILHHNTYLQASVDDNEHVVVLWNSESEYEQGIDLIVSCFDIKNTKHLTEKILSHNFHNHAALSTNQYGKTIIAWNELSQIKSTYFDTTNILWGPESVFDTQEIDALAVKIDKTGNSLIIWHDDACCLQSAHRTTDNPLWKFSSFPLLQEIDFLALGFNTTGRAFCTWVGDGDELGKAIYSNSFNIHIEQWSHPIITKYGLMDGISGYYIADEYYGMAIWEDFLIDALEYAVLSYTTIPQAFSKREIIRRQKEQQIREKQRHRKSLRKKSHDT